MFCSGKVQLESGEKFDVHLARRYLESIEVFRELDLHNGMAGEREIEREFEFQMKSKRFFAVGSCGSDTIISYKRGGIKMKYGNELQNEVIAIRDSRGARERPWSNKRTRHEIINHLASRIETDNKLRLKTRNVDEISINS